MPKVPLDQTSALYDTELNDEINDATTTTTTTTTNTLSSAQQQQQYSYDDTQLVNTANMHEAPSSSLVPSETNASVSQNGGNGNTGSEQHSATNNDTITSMNPTPTQNKISLNVQGEGQEEPDDYDEEIARIEREIQGLDEKNQETSQTVTKTYEMEIKQTQEVDERSIYVGNVDYSTTAQELRDLFGDCGDINRITIPANKFTGHPKGFAYIEFKDKESVSNALGKEGTPFKGREINVKEKRTNLPGMKPGGGGGPRGGHRGGRGGYRGGPPRGGFRGGYRGRGGGFRGGYRGGYPPRGGYRGRGGYHYAPY
mmetsp:Transcript_1936/g.6942  ORF Transcript_1936/g.6942 Transcript_1936/m.6942 type:complete len:313 (+) Transcript_1936:1902-2840(+)